MSLALITTITGAFAAAAADAIIAFPHTRKAIHWGRGMKVVSNFLRQLFPSSDKRAFCVHPSFPSLGSLVPSNQKKGRNA